MSDCRGFGLSLDAQTAAADSRSQGAPASPYVSAIEPKSVAERSVQGVMYAALSGSLNVYFHATPEMLYERWLDTISADVTKDDLGLRFQYFELCE